MNTYYMLMEEWLYTTESGRDPLGVTFDTLKVALLYAGDFIKNEVCNFSRHNKVDCLPPEEYSPCCGDEGGFIITARNGLDEWYYAVRVYKINPLTCSKSIKSIKSIKSMTSKPNKQRRNTWEYQ